MGFEESTNIAAATGVVAVIGIKLAVKISGSEVLARRGRAVVAVLASLVKGLVGEFDVGGVASDTGEAEDVGGIFSVDCVGFILAAAKDCLASVNTVDGSLCNEGKGSSAVMRTVLVASIGWGAKR